MRHHIFIYETRGRSYRTAWYLDGFKQPGGFALPFKRARILRISSQYRNTAPFEFWFLHRTGHGKIWPAQGMYLSEQVRIDYWRTRFARGIFAVDMTVEV